MFPTEFDRKFQVISFHPFICRSKMVNNLEMASSFSVYLSHFQQNKLIIPRIQGLLNPVVFLQESSSSTTQIPAELLHLNWRPSSLHEMLSELWVSVLVAIVNFTTCSSPFSHKGTLFSYVNLSTEGMFTTALGFPKGKRALSYT